MPRNVAAILLMIAAGGCALSPPPRAVTADGLVRVVGYNDMAGMLQALGKGFARHNLGVRFDFQLKSTRSAPDALIEGLSAFAPMGAEMEPADIAKYRARHGFAPLEIRIAHDSLDPAALSSPTAIYVHQENPLRALSMEQVAFAFSQGRYPAKLTWGDLGARGTWRDAPVHLKGLAGDTAIGRRTARILGIEGRLTEDVQVFRQSRDVAASAAADPYVLAFANLNHARPELRAIDLIVDGERRRADREMVARGRYPLDRHLLIYAPREADGSVSRFAARFLRYALSPEGQSIIARDPKGYLRLSESERRTELEKTR